MSKKNISATVDEDVYEYLQQGHVNCSGLVNDLVRRHMEGGSDDLLREFREQQLLEEAEEFESRAERKRERAEKIREATEKEAEEEKAELWGRAVEEITPPQLSHIDTETWQPETSNEAVQHFAAELEISPEQFVERYPEKRTEVME